MKVERSKVLSKDFHVVVFGSDVKDSTHSLSELAHTQSYSK